jgi:hypothetical protein
VSGEPLSEDERKALGDLLGSPIKYPNRFKQWFIDYMAQNIPPLPVDHIEGYVKTRGYGGDNTPGAITVGAGWVDLGGPTFDDLPEGTYLMLWGMYCPATVSGGGVTYKMGPVVDGGGNPSEDQACKVSVGASSSLTGSRSRSIDVGSSLDFRYRADTWSGTPSGAEIRSSWATLIRTS